MKMSPHPRGRDATSASADANPLVFWDLMAALVACNAALWAVTLLAETVA